jgi:phage recombination protein Bet
MNEVTTVEAVQRKSVLVSMADRYNMEPSAFEATVRATCIPRTREGREATREEFAAFLLVAHEYNLNPITREIYAFPKKGGGIVPIVSVDGWTSLVNSHGACDGFDFVEQHDEKGRLISTTCRMWRKDRGRPVEVTEYLEECIRDTEPWRMRHRMLRHKAMIQAARYAFGFSGIYDEDEGAKIAEHRDLRDVTPPAAPSALPAPATKKNECAQDTAVGPVVARRGGAADASQPHPPPSKQANALDENPPSPTAAKKADAKPAPAADVDPIATLKEAEVDFAAAPDMDRLVALWDYKYQPLADVMFPPDAEELMGAYRKHEQRLSP